MNETISIKRHVQWIDTDAAGIWHHSTMSRWADEIEAELHREIGIIDETFGHTPRVHVEFDYYGTVRFNDEVTVSIEVADLGDISVTYSILAENARGVLAKGRVVTVLMDPETGEKRRWPDHLREALSIHLAEGAAAS